MVLEEEIKGLSQRLKGSRGELVHTELEKLIEEKRIRSATLNSSRRSLQGAMLPTFLRGVREVGGVKVLTRLLRILQSQGSPRIC